MNTKTKKMIASTLAFGTLLGIGATSTPTQAHAATQTHQTTQTAYYTYNGNAGYNAKFVLDKQFRTALNKGKVTFNGIKLAPTKSSKTTTKYDQLFREYSKKDKTASIVDISLKNKLSLKDVQSTYGKNLKKVSNGKNNMTGIYYAKPGKNGATIWFDATKGKIDRIVIGFEKTSTVKKVIKK
ncbi:immunodominant staphylococcal antigen IsaB family protein [Staphylococcus caprae]|uniref:immunodominant staphylococcal antigen IsaB family protein n=1 Tax=Staphylococcus caprae TaxID=29380 RepID=UPI0024B4DE57|nr:hypothetical protein [Staphylococcus caprae]MDI9230614.1 hypothetical protein [Staphylococcus caprae]